MQRTFQSRINSAQWLLLAALTGFTGYVAWNRIAILLLLGLIGLVLLIERMIHATYILSDDTLTVHTSRFSPDLHIPLRSILRVERVKTTTALPFWREHVLVVFYTNDGFRERNVGIRPTNETDFVAHLQKKRKQLMENRPGQPADAQ